MLNLTPHPISLRFSDGYVVTFHPSGTVARVSTIETLIGSMDICDPAIAECDEQGNTNGSRFPVIRRELGAVEGLPEEGIECIVSAMVLDACRGRKAVYAPDTGSTAVRNEKGFVVAVTRLVAA